MAKKLEKKTVDKRKTKCAEQNLINIRQPITKYIKLKRAQQNTLNKRKQICWISTS